MRTALMVLLVVAKKKQQEKGLLLLFLPSWPDFNPFDCPKVVF
jgi:hypothetical protein